MRNDDVEEEDEHSWIHPAAPDAGEEEQGGPAGHLQLGGGGTRRGASRSARIVAVEDRTSRVMAPRHLQIF